MVEEKVDEGVVEVVEEEEEWLDGFLGVERDGEASEDNSSWTAACLGWSGGSSLRRLSRETRSRSTFWDDSCIRV